MTSPHLIHPLRWVDRLLDWLDRPIRWLNQLRQFACWLSRCPGTIVSALAWLCWSRQQRSRQAKRQTWWRAARRALLVCVGLVVLLQLGLFVAVETVRPDWRDPEFGLRLRALQRRIADAPGRPVVLAVGSSRTEMGLRPGELPPIWLDGAEAVVFNFGISGTGPIQQVLLIDRILRAGMRPAWVSLEVLPPALHFDGPVETMFDGAKLAWRDLAVVGPYCTDTQMLRRQWVLARSSPLSSARFMLVSQVVPAWLPWHRRLDYLNLVDEHGWMTYPRRTIGDDERQRGTAKAYSEYVENLRTYRISPLPDRALRAVLTRCQVEGIAVNLHLMPESRQFRAWYEPHAWPIARDYLQAIASEFGVALIDCRDCVDDCDFADGHHLLPDGASRFTAEYARQLAALLSR